MPTCRHCDKPRSLHRRGLCGPCYENRRIRKQYAPVKDCATVAELVEPTQLPEPTKAIPGTAAKILVMMARVAAGQILHHPSDVRLGDDNPMPLDVANRRAEIDAHQRDQGPLGARQTATKVKIKKRAKAHRKSQRAIHWHLFDPCCLFGACTRGRCECHRVKSQRFLVGRRSRPKKSRSPQKRSLTALPPSAMAG